MPPADSFASQMHLFRREILNMKSFLARMLMVAVVLGTSVLAGAEDKKDIVDTAVGAGSFKTLAAALKAADFVEMLKGAFAPKIESLTPEQARKLVEEFPGVRVENLGDNDEAYGNRCLPLNGLTSLDTETARALAGYEKGPLLLDGLTSLDPDTAKALAKFKGIWLALNGLTSLDTETARALAGYDKGPLLLNGLTSLDPDPAKALAEFKGDWLCLNGLTTLDADTAKALANGEYLYLNGLTTLDADTAKALTSGDCDILYLNGLTTLDSDPAKALAEFKGIVLGLEGLTTLDFDTAQALAEFKGISLVLDGLTTLRAATARALAEFKGNDLFLKGLNTLNADTAQALAEFKGEGLHLHGLTALDAGAAKALAEFKGERLFLTSLTPLDIATVKALVGFTGELLLQDRVADPLFMDKPLTPETALVWAAVSKGDLSRITAFESPDSVEIAAALATREGPLSLPNLKKISPKTLTALIEKRDVEIPLIEKLELITEPDGSGVDDFVIPEWLEVRERARKSKKPN